MSTLTHAQGTRTNSLQHANIPTPTHTRAVTVVVAHQASAPSKAIIVANCAKRAAIPAAYSTIHQACTKKDQTHTYLGVVLARTSDQKRCVRRELNTGLSDNHNHSRTLHCNPRVESPNVLKPTLHAAKKGLRTTGFEAVTVSRSTN